MKKSALLLLTTISLGVFAQTKKSDVSQSVSDDGKTMHITVKTDKNGMAMNYDRTFAVTGMSQKQKDALLKRVNDSLGIKPPPAPPAPHMLTSASSKTKNNSAKIEKTIKDDGKTMHLLFNSSKDGKEVNYDRTFNVKGLSKAQKEQLVKKVTDSLGIAGR